MGVFLLYGLAGVERALRVCSWSVSKMDAAGGPQDEGFIPSNLAGVAKIQTSSHPAVFFMLQCPLL